MRTTKTQRDIAGLVKSTLAGDVKAFTDLVKAFQNYAFASARSYIDDPDLACDAVQESFLTVYYQLHNLKKIESYPAWLNKIVRYSCYRILRKQKNHSVLSEEITQGQITENSPEIILSQKELQMQVHLAINSLPRELREIIYLFYIEEHSQKEVAAYLDLRISTINNRLHSARKILKRKMFDMVKESARKNPIPEEFAELIGKIIRVQGPVIEAEVKKGRISSLFENWSMTGKEKNSGKREL